jgi:Ca-activated chloride channel family protein
MTQLLGIFDSPWLLALVVVLPIAVALFVGRAYRERRRRLGRLGTPDVVARLVPPTALRAPRSRAVLLALAALFGAVAFAGPRWGTETTVVRGEGIDLVFALDASLSMMAEDERPSRLGRMKQEVQRILAASRGDRIGLIAFAGRSYILTPLTVDQGALDLYLDNLDPSVVGQAGSSLARAIRQGTALLNASQAESDKALVVMSDGEAFEPAEDVREAARLAREAGIAVVTVGFGTTEGANIPVREGDSVTLKRDDNGALVVTRYSPELLRAAAEAAGGTFIEAGATDKAGSVRRALATLRTQVRAAAAGQDRTPRFQLFVLPALVLLVVDTLLVERRVRRRRPAAAASTVPAAAAALLVLVLGACGRVPLPFGDRALEAYEARRYGEAAGLWGGRVVRGDREPRTIYNYGTALVAADSLARAVEVLDRASAARDDELRYRALFNLGLAHLKAGLAAKGDSGVPALDAALDSYKKVLLLRSSDPDAKWNYELALRERKERAGGGGGGGGGGEAPSPQPQERPDEPQPRPSGGLGEQQAERLLNSAAREEGDVQARKQSRNRPEPPPGGKDW